jgi:DNA-directed RNA polymerase specialized sigma24 family protein
VIPKGMTETEVLQTINLIANRLAGKFKFGYHELEDMKQQARLFAWEGLENYDGVRPLENFLWTHVRNRLYNFKRNNFGRPDKPCDTCPFFDMSFSNSNNYPCKAFDNEEECDLYAGWLKRNTAKRNIMNTANLDIDVKQASRLDEMLDQKHIFNIVDQAIPVHCREDWLRFINSLKLPKSRRLNIIEIVKEILEENNIAT